MNDRARYLGFAASVGAGIALLVYRFAVMGLVWDAPAKNVLQIAAPVVIVIGSQLLRPIAKKQFPVLLMLVAAVAGGGVAFGICYAAVPGLDRAPLTTRELAGFSIGLPPGTKSIENLDYNHGRVEVTAVLGTGSVTEVQWEPGAVFTPDELAMFTAGLAQSLGGTTVSTPVNGTDAKGAKTISVDLQTPKGAMYVTVVGCGSRRIIVMNGGDSSMKKLQPRMVASIACHPDATKDTAVGTLPWTVELPAGWFQVPSQAGQVQLTDGNDALLARGLDKMPDRAALPNLLQSLFAAAGQQMTIGAWTGDRFPARATFDGKPYGGWVMPIECRGQAVLVMGFAGDDAAADKLAQLVKTKGRCLAAGEVAPAWPQPGR